jgi:hypothetical protein
VAEFGLAILIVGGLLLIDGERLEWASTKIRDIFDWLSS